MLCLTPSLILARNLIQAELMKLAVDRVEESEPPNRTTSHFNKLLASFSVKVSQIMSHRNCGVCVCHSLAKYDCSWPASFLLCQSIKREGYFVIYTGRRNKKSDSRKNRKNKTKTAKLLHIIHYKKKVVLFFCFVLLLLIYSRKIITYNFGVIFTKFDFVFWVWLVRLSAAILLVYFMVASRECNGVEID